MAGGSRGTAKEYSFRIFSQFSCDELVFVVQIDQEQNSGVKKRYDPLFCLMMFIAQQRRVLSIDDFHDIEASHLFRLR